MRDFLEFLKRPKLAFPVLILVGVLVAFGGFLLKTRLSWFELTAENRDFWKMSENAGLFVPSPLEAYLLDTREELWPDRFNPKNPLRVADIPAFYSAVAKQRRWDLFSPFEFEGARQWSVLANTGHENELRIMLPNPNAASIRSEKECSPLMQDTMYRISQIWPQHLKDVQGYFGRCAPQGVHLLWWELQAALQKKDPEALRAIGQKFQAQMNAFPGQWSRWFALEAFQIAHVMAARIQEAGDK